MKINPLIRITLGLVSLTICIVLAGDFILGLTNDQADAVHKQRLKIGKTLALQFSSLAETDQIDTIREAMVALVERNRDVLSTALRSYDGRMLASAGDHKKHWVAPAPGESTETHTKVPLMVQSREWGFIEVSFAPIRSYGLPIFTTNPLLRFLAFIAGASFLGYLFFMKRTLTHLDPKAVIPDKVRATLDLLAEGVVLIDQQDAIVLANLSFADKFGCDPNVLTGRKLSELGWRSPGSNERIEEFPWTTAMKEGKSQTDFPIAVKMKSGASMVFAANSSPILDANFNLRGAMATFNDETALQEANSVLLEMMDKLRKSQDEVNKQNEELKRLATRDPMTNCLNRRSFFEKIEKTFSVAESEGKPLSVVMNDKHGHGVGDKVIQMLAKLLESKFGTRDNICRYGGEEFCVMLAGKTLNEAIDLAQQARGTIESYATMGIESKSSFTVTSSLGVASLEQGAKSFAQLIDQADRALYQAKESGRNRVEQWSTAMSGDKAA
jgi:diguanylate cyclase (GGDEF)-like protein/PAS domain S-box-containing protein